MQKRSLKMALLTAALSMVACLAFANDKCKECHPDVSAKHAKSLHAKAGKGCDSCHGGVDAHLASGDKKDIITFGQGDVKKQNAQCLSCHAKNQKLTFWDNSKHKREEVACVSCHSIHTSAKPAVSQPETCYKCHLDVRADNNKFSHHPVAEGKVKCSDCHNPHGNLGHGSINAENVTQLCYKCHADKRGPYVWEHPPVEEDCTKCHSPHGSKALKLLKDRLPNLCQNCHDWSRHPGTPYGGNADFVGTPGRGGLGRSCTNCHSTIHGSNAPGTAGKAFTR